MSDAAIRLLQARTIGTGLRLLHKAYPGGLRMGRHAHDDWRFCLALDGAYTDSWRGDHRRRTSWQLSLHPEGETHTSVFHAPSTCFHIELHGPWRTRLLGDAGIGGEPLEFLHGPVPLVAAQLFRASHDRDACAALVIEGLACELIGWAGREQQLDPRLPPWLRNARALVHDRFRETLDLDEIARGVGVHPVHLARQFKRAFGHTIGEYLRLLRVDYVARRLAEDVPLAVLALDAAFADQSHLTRVFKRVTGRTPSQARAAGATFIPFQMR